MPEGAQGQEVPGRQFSPPREQEGERGHPLKSRVELDPPPVSGCFLPGPRARVEAWGCPPSAPRLGMRYSEDQCALSSVVQWDLQSVGRQETWASAQGLLLSDTLRRESYHLPRPQSHSLRNGLMGLNLSPSTLLSHPTVCLCSTPAAAQSPGTSQACSRGLLGPREVGDTWAGLGDLPYKWL